MAQLVKARGVSFSLTDSFLTQTKLAGGDGVLVERLMSPESSAGALFSREEDESVEHLAKCAELVHIGDFESAEAECRASVEESPTSPWPLLIVADLLERNAVTPRTPADPAKWWDEQKATTAEHDKLLKLAAALDPQRLTSSQLDPGSVNPYWFLAKNAVAAGSQPISPMSKPVGAVVPDPDLAGTHRALAYGYFRANDFESAQRELKEAIRLEPDNADTHTCLAFLYLFGQNENAGIAELREVVRIAPFDSEKRETVSTTLERLGRTTEATAELKSLLSISPRDVRTSNVLVELYLTHQDRKSAIGELRRSLKETSLMYDDQAKFVELRFWDMDHLGYLLKQNRDFDAATEQYLFLLRYQPENADLHNNYGNVLMDEHRLDEAMAEYDLALRYDPKMASAHHNIGICLSQQKNFDEAIDEFRKALELNSEEPHTRLFLGIALGQKGDLVAARVELQQYVEKNPKDPAAHTNLAYALDQLKDSPGAIKELKLALELDPDSPNAQNDLAWIYATAEDPKLRNATEALVLARKAVKASTTPNPAFLDTLAEALLLNGQPDEALKTEQQVAKLDPNNPVIAKRLSHFQAACSDSARPKH